MSAQSSSRSSMRVPPSAWTLGLFVVWIVLAVRIGLALVRNEPFSGDLGIPLIALFAITAVLGSRVWSLLHPADTEEDGSKTEAKRTD